MITSSPLLGLPCFRWVNVSSFARTLGVLFLLTGASAFGASPAVEAVKKADAERLAATFNHDADKLGALLSSDLVYGLNDGSSMSRAAFLESQRARTSKYDSNFYEDAKFTEVGPDVVIMTGRSRVKVSQTGIPPDIYFRVLAVWRNEGGAWKLFAYQSARISTPTK